jgi:hypothetical protein
MSCGAEVTPLVAARGEQVVQDLGPVAGDHPLFAEVVLL